ncbi:Hypothetical predicted protein [Mytilus galloprovincialis]|uniref:Uncharacterized protein n=1 Tax=Mytilus galloprovincialis TaxID=29158 RepID=A0A8B6F1D6_MYTGA|nr:Hypothetical predicted protein [Mytilus galloprovincialis]
MTHGKDVMSKEKHFKPVPKKTFTPPEPKRAKHKLHGPRIGGRTSSNQYLASNSDPSDDAITSKMNVMLLPLAVFLTFPTIRIACCIFHTDCTGSPLRSTSTGNSHTFYHLSSYMLSSALLLGTVTLSTISLATCCHQLFYWEQPHFLPSLYLHVVISSSTGNSHTFYHLSSYMLSSALLLGTVTLSTISLATYCHQLFYWNSHTFYHLSSYMLSSALLLGTATLSTISLAICCHQLFYWEQPHFLPSL